MAVSRFYAALSALLFAAVCAYAGAALFAALEPLSREAGPAPAKAGGGELRGIILRREEKAPEDLSAPAGERIPAGEHGESAIFSPFSDGYELSPLQAEELSPETLTLLMDRQPTGSKGPRLIYGFDCYYAAFYSGHENIEPGPCRLRFEGEEASRRAELVSCSRSASDCALLFRLMLAPELLDLRFCRAELIY